MLDIRPATAADVVAIARVHAASWRQTYRGKLPAASLAQRDEAFRRQQWARLYRQDHVLVALVADQVVGFVAGGAQRSHPALASRYPGEVYGLYVAPTCQHQGVGWRLLTAKRRALGTAVTLDCLATNQVALAFYHRQGGRDLQTGVYRAAQQTFATTVLGFPKL